MRRVAEGRRSPPDSSEPRAGLEASELTEPLFPGPVNRPLLDQTIRMYLSNQRKGTSSVRNRHNVRGSTRKIYRQKGTGQARHGDIKAPLFVGGGVAFGPRPRDWHFHPPKQVLKKALASALAHLSQNGKVCVVPEMAWTKPKTKQGVALLQKLGVTSPLVVLDHFSPEVVRSFRNIKEVEIREAGSLNAWDVLRKDEMVITEGALSRLKERLKEVLP